MTGSRLRPCAAAAVALLAAGLPAWAAGQEQAAERIDVTMSDSGGAEVVHSVAGGGEKAVALIAGASPSDVVVEDADGDVIRHSAEGERAVAFTAPDAAYVKYGLDGAAPAEGGGPALAWRFFHPATTTFHLPGSVRLAFVNDRPLYFAEGGGSFNCHGCQMVLEFVPGQEAEVRRIAWEDGREFEVEVWATPGPGRMVLDQPARSIEYEFGGPERWVTLVLPHELLGGPYQAQVDGERIRSSVFDAGGNRSGVSLRLSGEGTAAITGASVIPEFPAAAPALAAAVAAAVAAAWRAGPALGRAPP